MRTTPILDIADLLPLATDTHQSRLDHIPGQQAAFRSRTGISAFASHSEYAQRTEVCMRDSAQRLHLSVWLRDGIDIALGGRQERVGQYDVVLAFSPDDVMQSHFQGSGHHVGLMLQPMALSGLDEVASEALMGRLANSGGLLVRPARAEVLRAARELDAALVDPRSSMLLREAKTLEMLARLLEDSGEEKSAPALTRLQQNRLRQARELLLRDLANAPDIAALARECGMNAFQLKKGFQTLFGQSVHGVYQQERMGAAWRNIAERDMSVQQAGALVGYQNMSHFSAAFRKAFGVLPGVVARRG